jgi:hypothetical protein
MVPGKTPASNVICVGTPSALASNISWRKDPGPESAVLVTTPARDAAGEMIQAASKTTKKPNHPIRRSLL